MRRTPVALVPLGVSLLIAACVGDRDTTAPTSLAPRPTASAVTLPACDFSAVRSAAHGFFDAGNDVVYDYINAMSKAAGPARTAAGWQIVNEIAKARLTSRQETPWSATAAAGETLALNVFACSQGIGDVSSVPAGALGSAIFNGIFEVRGGGYATGPALGYLVVNNAKALSAPRYGVENRPANTQWAGNPFLVVGVPTQYGPSFVGVGTNINTNGTPVNGFDLISIPVNQSKANKTIGVCIKAVTTGNTANLLIHNGVIQKNVSPTQICDPQYGALSSPSWFASLSRRAASFFTPTLAYAQLGLLDFSGGDPTSWSPNQVGAVPGSNVALTFTAQSPKTGNIGDNFHFEVTASINETVGNVIVRHPVPDVTITIGIDGNFGTPGLIDGVVQKTTNGQGVATFDVSFTKAGGTYVAAIGDLGGVTTQTGRSDQFFIKNKK